MRLALYGPFALGEGRLARIEVADPRTLATPGQRRCLGPIGRQPERLALYD